jgi:rhodanese-related sulfurtransferase
VAQKLLKMGFTKAYALKGGWKEWSKNNYPTEKK